MIPHFEMQLQVYNCGTVEYHDDDDDDDGSPAYSHQSKSHHGGVLTVMIIVGDCRSDDRLNGDDGLLAEVGSR